MELRQVIKMYLELQAASNTEFAAKYANVNKTLDECLLFIQHTMYEKAKKIADEKKGGKQSVCIAPSDDEIFALAIQYYNDTDLKVSGTSFDNVQLLSISATTITDEEKAEQRKQAIEKYQQEVIAEAKKKDEERKENARKKQEAKKGNPVMVPDAPSNNDAGESSKESKTSVVQMDLFG